MAGRRLRLDPGRRFHPLWDKVCRGDVLRRGWVAVRANNSAPGIDRTTLEEIEHEYGALRLVDELAAEPREGRYRPLPARGVLIPKPGRPGEVRPLAIAAVRDRVVRYALKIVLEPVLEADFLPCGFGFRPRRSAHDALQVVITSPAPDPTGRVSASGLQRSLEISDQTVNSYPLIPSPPRPTQPPSAPTVGRIDEVERTAVRSGLFVEQQPRVWTTGAREHHAIVEVGRSGDQDLAATRIAKRLARTAVVPVGTMEPGHEPVAVRRAPRTRAPGRRAPQSVRSVKPHLSGEPVDTLPERVQTHNARW